jgi:AraC-like DNA-binding protein
VTTAPVASFAPPLLLATFQRLIEATSFDGLQDQPDRFIRYSVRRREAVRVFQMDLPALVLLWSGSKEIGSSGLTAHCRPGTLTLLPANTAIDVVNAPDERSGVYAAAIILFPLPLLQRVRLLHPTAFRPIGLETLDPRRWDIPATPSLQEAVTRVLTAVSESNISAEILDHRVMEVALLLADKPLLPARALLRDGHVSAAVTSLLSGDLARPWTAASVADLTGMSEATLRRRLAAEGVGLRSLLGTLRRSYATRLQENGLSALDAALACGFRSAKAARG